MKKLTLITLVLIAILLGCREDEFLDRTPTGTLSFDVLTTQEGIQSLLIGAYGMLDGVVPETFLIFATPASNWLWGEVVSDNAHRGSEPSDIPDFTRLEQFAVFPVDWPLVGKWSAAYEGVTRSNDVMRAVENARQSQAIDEDVLDQLEAEARFLRGYYHLEVKQVFHNVPFLTEDLLDVRVPNDVDIWPQIAADFQFAIDLLPETQPAAGQVDQWVAKAYRAKALMHQGDFNTARPILDDIIDNGPYRLLDNYSENFEILFNNSQEAIFSVQHSVNDGSPEENNGNFGNGLNFPAGPSPYGCCGFFQPSQNLVNAFQTDPLTGLPLIGFEGNEDTFNNDPGVASDLGISSSEPFDEHTGTLDPRLDWTVGRRGIPYQGFGDHPGRDWIRDQPFGGPYSPRKNVWKAVDQGVNTGTGGWYPNGVSALNTVVLRFAQILLWRAEVAIEDGDLEMAMGIVNRIRRRARDGDPVFEMDGVTPAASYLISEYPPDHSAFTNMEDARKAVHFETRLELAMEGHRFFDLVRWNRAAEVMNTYLEVEQVRLPQLLFGVTFTEGVNERMPIPQSEIDLTFKDGAATLQQNPGY